MRATKKFTAGLVILAIFFLNIPLASAFSYPSPTQAMDQILTNLGVNKSELKYNIQTMNVSRQKKQPPQVSLHFEPVNPVDGQKVLAIATPTYFMNDGKDLYFTWYLEQAGCDEDDDPDRDTRDKCDLDDDGRVNIDDYKLKAARILAGNNFEWDAPGVYDTSAGDDDGYTAVFGGEDQREKTKHCYIHDTNSGNEYEITCDKHLFPNADDHETGDGTFGKDEEEFFHTDPQDSDTADTGNGDEANVAGLGQNKFSWNYEAGDKIGVVVEGISVDPTQYPDSSYKTMWALLKNKCDLDVTVAGYPKTTSVDIPSSDGVTANANWSSAAVPSGWPAIPEGKTLQKVTQIETEAVKSTAGFTAVIETTGIVRYELKDTLTDEVTTLDTALSQSLSYQTSDAGNPDNVFVVASYAYPQSESITFDNLSSAISNVKKSSDINQCLRRNMVEPFEGGGIEEKMEIVLDYSPDNPMNDTNEIDGDELSVRAIVTNAKNPQFLTYTWQVYQGNEPNPESWGSPIVKSNLPQVTQTTGIGLDTLKFRLNFPSVKKYLRVKVTVSENVSNRVTRVGNSDIVIPVSSTDKKIKVYSATVSEDLNLSLGQTQRCLTGLDSTLCRVAKNEIVGLSVDKGNLTDFLWSINGEPITYEACIFEGCNSARQTNVSYFPVIDDNGYRYSVTLSAVNQKTGEKVNISREFEVYDPAVEIVTADISSLQPVFLGYYVDLDQKLWPDYSEVNYEALADTAIKLKPNFIGYPIGQDYYYWIVDGYQIDKDNYQYFGYNLDSDGTLTLPGKPAGESYEIGLHALYTQDAKTKKMLNQYWNVPLAGFYEKNISAQVSINSVSTLTSNSVSQKTNDKIIASVFSAAPSYFLFLLRIVLTIFVILIVVRIVFSLTPTQANKNDE